MPSRYTSLVRYKAWDGTQKVELEADSILSAISEDLMEFGDLQQAMRYLMQRGMDTEDGNYIKGLRDLLRQLKDQRRDRLERYDMNSILEDIKQQLDEILVANHWLQKFLPFPTSRLQISKLWLPRQANSFLFSQVILFEKASIHLLKQRQHLQKLPELKH